MSATWPKITRAFSQILLVLVAGLIGLAALGACEKKAADAPTVQGIRARPATIDAGIAAMPVMGRWKSDELCLEIFANTDVEISLHGKDPKVLVMGRAALLPLETGEFRLQVADTRIWKARYLSSCREVHETGHWADAMDVLGALVHEGTTASFTIKMISVDELEFCGMRCAHLHKDEPLLPAHWRRTGLAFPDHAEMPWKAGDLLELKLAEHSEHLWAGLSGNQIAEIDMDVNVLATSQDEFKLQITASRIGALNSEHALSDPNHITLLDTSVSTGEPLTLSLTRLSGQRLSVCGTAQRCEILERQFDSYSFELHQ